MKLDRLLGILTTLLNNDKIKAKELAERFEVSIRTIYRDLDNICMAGIPIVTYQGGDGGISIAEGYKLDKGLLTNEDLSNILIGLKGIDSITDSSKVKLLLEKLTPRESSIITEASDIQIDLASFYKGSLTKKINLLREAISVNHLVSFRYFSNKGSSNRIVEPYYITFKWSEWYVMGYCCDRLDFRLFKLNRMDALKLNDQIYQKRDIQIEQSNSEEFFTKDIKQVTLLLEASLEYKIVESYGVDAYEYTKDNRIKFILEYTNKAYALETILSFGDKAEVISPADIKNEIKAIAENIFKKY